MKIRKIKRVGLWIISTIVGIGGLVLFQNCGNSHTTNGGSESTVNYVQLKGTWQGICIPYDQGSEIRYFTLNSSRLSIGAYQYSQPGCTGQIYQTVFVDYTYSLNGLVPDGSGAITVSLANGENSILAGPGAVLADLNTNAYCGITNWQAGIPQTFLPGDASSCAVGNYSPQITLDISGTTLYIGGDDGHQGIDFSYGFQKQN